MNPLQYKIDFLMFIRGISHGYNGTHDKLVMALNLKDFLIFFFLFRYFFFKNNVVEIVRKISTLHINIRGTDCLQSFSIWIL